MNDVELLAHARILRNDMSHELPNGVGNTIAALCDRLEAMTTQSPDATEQVERVARAIWSARQDKPDEAYALKMRLSWDEACRAAAEAIAALPSNATTNASLVEIGTGCDDCADNLCTMNCSGSILATNSEWIAASLWAGVFPVKASAEQVAAYRAMSLATLRASNPDEHGPHCSNYHQACRQCIDDFSAWKTSNPDEEGKL